MEGRRADMTQPRERAPSDIVDLLVVGGGPAGAAAAFAYRQAEGTGSVVLLSADEYPPYARPPLSKEFLRGESKDAFEPLHARAEYSDADIDLRLRERATTLDVRAREVTTGESSYRYRRCVLAVGSESVRPDLAGVDLADVYTLRSVADARRLREHAGHADRAIVVGSGFIGCEAASSLARLGVRTTLLAEDSLPQQARLGRWVGEQLAEWLARDGVELIGRRLLVSIESSAEGLVVRTSGRARARADLVMLATGARPNAALAESAGLSCEQGRIRVDSQLRTSAPGVFAAGDVALATNTRTRRPLAVEHWGDAEAMGSIAGANAAGRDTEWDSVPGFWSTIGDRTLKYAAWGDGFDEIHVDAGQGGDFAVWYGQGGRTVGVLTHNRDADYDSGQSRILVRDPLPIGRW
jgi:3-phenylpropionate/trans-cinnamate dioxygenase ferredoxin reductase component